MSTSRAAVLDFLAQPALVLAGVSRRGQNFGALARRELAARGYRVYVVHPEAPVASDPTWVRSLAELPEPVGALLTVVPPAETARVVREAHAAGITRVWMQQGSESPEAIDFCTRHQMAVVAGECVLMYADPKGVHRFHGWLWRVIGKAAS